MQQESVCCPVSCGFSVDGPELSDPAEFSRSFQDTNEVALAVSVQGLSSWIMWDGRQGKLHLVGDRLGISPIFCSNDVESFVASPDIAQLLDSLRSLDTPNQNSIQRHLRFLRTAGGETFYEGVRSLHPAELLTISRSGDGKIERTSVSYWDPTPNLDADPNSDVELAAALDQLLEKVIGQYLPAQEAGILLSGGMDSTTLAAKVRDNGGNVTALSWTTPEIPGADEIHLSRMVAKHLGINRLVELSADNLWPLSSVDGIKTQRESPQMLYRELWEAAFQKISDLGIRTVFTGVGGDELFSRCFNWSPTASWRDRLKGIRQRGARGFIEGVRRRVIGQLRKRKQQVSIRQKEAPWHSDLVYEGNSCEPDQPDSYFDARRQQADNTRGYGLYRFAQTLAAKYGIELRCPLLDHRLVEFSLGLPYEQTFHGGQDKIILRNAMRSRLPEEITTLPLRTYHPLDLHRRGLRRGKETVLNLMTDMRAAELGFFDEKKLRECYADYLDGNGTYEHHLWPSLTLEDWLRRHF